MPQIASNRLAQSHANDADPTAAYVNRLLESLMQSLDQEICNAILEEDNELAERLNVPFTQVRKLAQVLANRS